MATAAVEEENDELLCFGVMTDNDVSVVLMDASGSARKFAYRGEMPKNAKLCFSSHGHKAAEEFMTPCFDEEGNHGDPPEECFCGIDTPHVHAHFRNPEMCVDHAGIEIGQSAKNFDYLTSLTLHPVEEDHTGDTLYLEFSDTFPNQCNSREFRRHLSTVGKPWSSKNRRLFKVKHEDHVDYLVHNEETGYIHLEHNCTDCGDVDLHGRFERVATRRIFTGEDDNSTNVSLHIFQPSRESFRLNDIFGGLFDVHAAARVKAALPSCCMPDGTCRNHMVLSKKGKPSCCHDGVCSGEVTVGSELTSETDSIIMGAASKQEGYGALDQNNPKEAQHDASVVGRSQLYVNEICCASEIPAIRSIVEPLPGVSEISVNTSSKMVYVTHDFHLLSAQAIMDALNDDLFGAKIVKDAGAVAAAAEEAASVTMCRSQFHVEEICCASEIPAIKSIVEPIAGVTEVSVNASAKTVYVQHDSLVVAAQDIANALNDELFGASVVRDGGAATKAANTQIVAVVRSVLALVANDKVGTKDLKAFLTSNYEDKQVESFAVDLPSREIEIVHNPFLLSVQQVQEDIRKRLGVESIVTTDGAIMTTDEKAATEEEELFVETERALPKPAVLASGVLWVLSLFSLIGGPWQYLRYVALVSVAFSLPSVGRKAFATVKRCQLDVNVLMFVAAFGALLLQDYTESAAVAFMFSLSEWLESRATTRARNALSSIVNLRPETANLVLPGSKEIVVLAASAVPVGAIVSVKTGDKIPCDGVVVEGSSSVDESSLTGESLPVPKTTNDPVSGGTINCGFAELLVRTTATTEHSAVSKLIRLVEDAQASRSPTEKIVDEFASVYTPIVIVTSLGLATIPWVFGVSVGLTWSYTSLVLLVVACPCALIISTPITYVAGLAATAQRGILIKGGAFLEALGKVKKIAMDKTGTLTEGDFALVHLKTFGSRSRLEVLEYLTMIEERAHHPLANAIVAGTEKEGVGTARTKKMSDHTHLPGEGVMATVDGKFVHVGNARLFERLGLLDGLPDDAKIESNQWTEQGGTVGFMSIEGEGIVSSYCVADSVRPESERVISALVERGIDPIMLTGDNDASALAVAKQVGLGPHQIQSQLFPEDKLRFIEDLKEAAGGRAAREGSLVLSMRDRSKKRELVLMCGDGVNDAPALAAAHVGVAMGAGGSALALETSDVTMLDSNLEKLLYCIDTGRRVNRKIVENVVFSLAAKAVVMVLALLGYVQLWGAIAADVGAMLVVTLNGMTLLPPPTRHQKEDGDNERKMMTA